MLVPLDLPFLCDNPSLGSAVPKTEMLSGAWEPGALRVLLSSWYFLSSLLPVSFPFRFNSLSEARCSVTILVWLGCYFRISMEQTASLLQTTVLVFFFLKYFF